VPPRPRGSVSGSRAQRGALKERKKPRGSIQIVPDQRKTSRETLGDPTRLRGKDQGGCDKGQRVATVLENASGSHASGRREQ